MWEKARQEVSGDNKRYLLYTLIISVQLILVIFLWKNLSFLDISDDQKGKAV